MVVDTTAAGDHDGVITIDSNGGSAAIRVLARVTPPTTGTVRQITEPEGAAPEKAPGPSTTEAPETAEWRVDTGSRRTPSIPPGDLAAPDQARPPSGARRPPDRRRRRLSTRGRIFAGAGAGVALILIVVVSVNAATKNTTSTPTGTLITTPPPTGKIIFRDDFTAKGTRMGGHRPTRQR